MENIGDYIVVTRDYVGRNGKLNYCYKRHSYKPINSEHFPISENNTINPSLTSIRKATKEEIEEWERRGEHYDITTIKKSDDIPEYAECLSSTEPDNFVVGRVYFVDRDKIITSEKGYRYTDTKFSFGNFYPNYFKFKPSSKEAFDNQNGIKKTKRVEDLAYPDVIHITSQEQWDKFKGKANLSDYNISYDHYLIGAGLGNKSSYDGNNRTFKGASYNIYEFEDIIFPEEKKESWCVKRNDENKLIIKNWGKSIGGNPDGTANYYDGTANYYGLLNGKYYYSHIKWGILLTDKEFYEKIGMEPEKLNLVGRWIKHKKTDKYEQILDSTYEGLAKTNLSGENIGSWRNIHMSGDTKPSSFIYEYELMPIGFIPPNKEEEYKVGDWVVVLETGWGCGQDKINIPLQVTHTWKPGIWGDCIQDVEVNRARHPISKNNKPILRRARPDEIPNNMNETDEYEKLWEEAKRRYPIGTVFKVAHQKSVTRKVTSHYIDKNRFFHNGNTVHINIISSAESNFDECKSGSVGLYNKTTKTTEWAEIVEDKSIFDLSNTKIRVDTPEISELVQKKAFELGWKWNNGDKFVARTDKPWLNFYDDKAITYSEGIGASGHTEIQLSDLGITDPRVFNSPEIQKRKRELESFVLPEKWCIEITSDNRAILQEFYKNNMQGYPKCQKDWELGNPGSLFHYPSYDGRTHSCAPGYLENKHGYKRISFEQFKTHVLGQKYMIGIDPIYHDVIDKDLVQEMVNYSKESPINLTNYDVNLKINQPVSVRLKSTENEVKINVKPIKSIQLNN